MFLCQGTNTIEDYTGQFCALYNHLKWKDAVFKDFYCYGLNEPLRSCMPRGRNELNLEHCMDYALLLSGSHFTVGKIEEDASPKHFFWEGAVHIKLRWPQSLANQDHHHVQ